MFRRAALDVALKRLASFDSDLEQQRAALKRPAKGQEASEKIVETQGSDIGACGQAAA